MASTISTIVWVTLLLSMAMPISATVYTVGDSPGWALGVDYSTWTSKKTFKVGDTLVFNYGSGHTVDEVSASDYKGCNTGNSITTDSSGKTTIALKKKGKHYFICAVSGHCDGGMKVAVTVTSGSSPSPSPSPSPSSSSGSSSTSPASDSSDTTTSPVAKTPTSKPTPTDNNSSSGFTFSASFLGAVISLVAYLI